MLNDELSILITDDDIWTTKVLNKTIKHLGFNKVTAVHSGYDAITFAIEEKPDIIFLDIIMSGIDGLQTLKMLKKIPATKDVKVIIVSGSTDIQHLGSAMKLGAADYISKPFSSKVIQQKISNLYPTVFNNNVNAQATTITATI